MGNDFNSPAEGGQLRRRRGGRGVRLTGPILLVTLGLLFLIGQFVPYWDVGRTWPVILIVIGLAKLLESVWAGGSTPSS